MVLLYDLYRKLSGQTGKKTEQDLINEMKLKSTLSNLSQGLGRIGDIYRGQPGRPMQNVGGGPLQELKLREMLAQTKDRQVARERERDQTFAQDALVAPERYQKFPKSGEEVLWNQPPGPGLGPATLGASQSGGLDAAGRRALLARADQPAFVKAAMESEFPGEKKYGKPIPLVNEEGETRMVRFPEGGGEAIEVAYTPVEEPPDLKASDYVNVKKPGGGSELVRAEDVGGRELYEKDPAPLAFERKMEMANIDPSSPEGQELIRADLAGQQISFEQTPGGGVKLTVGKGTGGGDLEKKTAGVVEAKILSSSDTLDAVREIRKKFKPEYQEIGTRWDQWITSWRSKGGLDISPEDRGVYEGFVSYRTDAGRMFSEILNRLAGTAVTPLELERTAIFTPNPGTGIFDGDDPIQLAQKLDSLEEYSRRAMLKYHYIRLNGLTINDVDMDEMPGLVQQRGDELEAKFSEEGLSGDELYQKVQKNLAVEFGQI